MHYNSSININALALGNKLNEKVSLIYEIDLTDLNLSVSCKNGIDDDNRTYDLSQYADVSNLTAILIQTRRRGPNGGGSNTEEWNETSNPVITIKSEGGYFISNNIARPYCAKTQSIKSIRLKSK